MRQRSPAQVHANRRILPGFALHGEVVSAAPATASRSIRTETSGSATSASRARDVRNSRHTTAFRSSAPTGCRSRPTLASRTGNISWAQGTVSDMKGNIWIASCGNGNVTQYPRGEPERGEDFRAWRDWPREAVRHRNRPQGLGIRNRQREQQRSCAAPGRFIATGGRPSAAAVSSSPSASPPTATATCGLRIPGWLDVPCPSGTHTHRRPRRAAR